MTDFTFQTNPFQTLFIYVFYDPKLFCGFILPESIIGEWVVLLSLTFYYLYLISVARNKAGLNTDLGVG